MLYITRDPRAQTEIAQLLKEGRQIFNYIFCGIHIV